MSHIWMRLLDTLDNTQPLMLAMPKLIFNVIFFKGNLFNLKFGFGLFLA